eukprot:TRINITY_DN14852_c0_g1_i1.p1 TRINITY_DN14852_c0_g1~~TRINITY_DN14852_c0_g1_i1.p1  ORF type:complete len:413 (+),score=75.61 TRINITY_DN14852_c0_g1_i1:136-1374(+)
MSKCVHRCLSTILHSHWYSFARRNVSSVAAQRNRNDARKKERVEEEEPRVYISSDYQGYKGMQIVFLGTASSMPTPTRNTSCIALRLEGKVYLFDCGEGSQKKFNELPFRQNGIDKIFITHMHGDHIFGLPGLVTGIGTTSSRLKKPIEIYGPEGLRNWLRVTLNASYARVPIKYVVHELVLPKEKQSVIPKEMSKHEFLHKDEIRGKDIHCTKYDLWEVFSDEKYCVKAGLLCHSVPCWGFVVQESHRAGRFLVDRAEELGIESSKDRELLVQGKHINVKGKKIVPAMVIGPPRQGRKVVFLGDTCGSNSLKSAAYGADVVVHECTLPEEDAGEAYKKTHSTATMAGRFAKSVNASSLILTHFGGKLIARADRIAKSVDSAKKAFGKNLVIAANDDLAVTVRMSEETLDSG